jgi:hypothetical protein
MGLLRFWLIEIEQCADAGGKSKQVTKLEVPPLRTS